MSDDEPLHGGQEGGQRDVLDVEDLAELGVELPGGVALAALVPRRQDEVDLGLLLGLEPDQVVLQLEVLGAGVGEDEDEASPREGAEGDEQRLGRALLEM